jgi:hypothetical protein
MTVPPVLQKPQKVRVLVHPRAPGVRAVEYSDGNYVLFRADGKQLSRPHRSTLREWTAKGWRLESAVPGREASLLGLAQELLDRAREELDRDLVFEVSAP